MNFEHSKAVRRLPDQFFSNIQNQVAKIAKHSKEDIINLSLGTPDLQPPATLIEYLKTAVDKSHNNKYGPYRGRKVLKEAVAHYYEQEFGVILDPDKEVAVFDGTKGAIIKVSQALLNPGDLALLPDPGFPDYKSGIALAGASYHTIPLKPENKYLVQYSNIPETIADKAKLLFINYPNNPTGAVADSDFYQKTVDFARNHQVCIVHDAAYERIVFDDHSPTSFLQAEGAKDYGIELFSLSKMFNITGWRIGFAVGNYSVIEALNLLQDHTTVSLYGGLQEAATKALRSDLAFPTQLRQIYQDRRDNFIDEIKSVIPDIQKPQGSFFIWLKVPDSYTSQEFVDQLLNQANVLVANGAGFGSQGEGYVRIGLIDSQEKLSQAARRIKFLVTN